MAQPALEPARRASQLRRLRAKLAAYPVFGVPQRSNGDEARYAQRSYIGSFAKGLAHGALGLPDPAGYRAYLRAIATGTQRALDAIPSPFLRGLVAGVLNLDYAYEGDDATQFALPAAPALASAATAAETVELYWAALARDVPFSHYDDDATVAAACRELTALTACTAPRSGGAVTPQLIFRGWGAALRGPLLSQFYWIDVARDPLAAAPQQLHFSLRGHDFMTQREEFVALQERPLIAKADRAHSACYMYSMRCLADCLGRSSAEAVFANALAFIGGLPSVQPFFDPVLVRELAAGAQVLAGRATFFQKLLVHRRVRPEAVGWLVDLTRRGHEMPLHPTLLHARAVDAVERRHGTALLPQAYPGGCPPHPSYPAAHSGIAGAVVTILKAFIVDDAPFPDPVTASNDGSALGEYHGAGLTLGGELDKLAMNFAFGRTGAGVHFRSDNHQGLLLGEAVALSLLRDRAAAMPRLGGRFSVRTFDGRTVRVA